MREVISPVVKTQTMLPTAARGAAMETSVDGEIRELRPPNSHSESTTSTLLSRGPCPPRPRARAPTPTQASCLRQSADPRLHSHLGEQ
jgi:hypothetical protein